MDTTDTTNTKDAETTNTKRYLCPYCSKVFHKAGNRTRHQNKFCKQRPEKPPPKQKSSYQCTKPHCEKTFKRKLNRDRHCVMCQY